MKASKIFIVLISLLGSVALGADDPALNYRVAAFARANIGNRINAGVGQDLVITALLKCGGDTVNMRPITVSELRSGDIIDFRTCTASRNNVRYFNVPYQQWAVVEARMGNDIIIEAQGYNGVKRVVRGGLRLGDIQGQVFYYRPQTR